MSIPSIVELAGVFENPGSALRYLVIHEVLQVTEICSREACEGQMKVYNRLKPYLYRCTRKRTCGMYLSVYKDSFFGSTRLSANKVLLIAYLWLTKSLNSAMITQVGVSGNTITDWTNHLRGLRPQQAVRKKHLTVAVAVEGSTPSFTAVVIIRSCSQVVLNRRYECQHHRW